MPVSILRDCCHMNDRLAELISRKLSGEITSAELQELEQWLQSHPGDQYFADLLISYWNNIHDAAPDPVMRSTADQHFEHILQMAAEQDQESAVPMIPRNRWLKRLAIAASVVGICFLSIKLYQLSRPQPAANTSEVPNQVTAQKGARSKMLLPDGTQVWLNSDSRLQYSSSFNSAVREVTLEGEAYFDVTKIEGRPFIVHTSAIDIRVLGTAFNVKSYDQEKTIETTLIHGLVEVTNKSKPQAPKIILRPKEKLVFNKPDNQSEITKNVTAPSSNRPEKQETMIAITALPRNRNDSTLVETSWVYNRLLFEGDSFRELAVKMERWFNVRIEFKNDRVANYRLRGVFEDETIEQALQALQLVSNFNYKIKNNTVEITR